MILPTTLPHDLLLEDELAWLLLPTLLVSARDVRLPITAEEADRATQCDGT